MGVNECTYQHDDLSLGSSIVFLAHFVVIREYFD